MLRPRLSLGVPLSRVVSPEIGPGTRAVKDRVREGSSCSPGWLKASPVVSRASLPQQPQRLPPAATGCRKSAIVGAILPLAVIDEEVVH